MLLLHVAFMCLRYIVYLTDHSTVHVRSSVRPSDYRLLIHLIIVTCRNCAKDVVVLRKLPRFSPVEHMDGRTDGHLPSPGALL